MKELKQSKKVVVINQQGDAEIFLYGMIGRYESVDTHWIIKDIEELRKTGCKNLTFFVNSDGGDVIQGQALWNYLNRSGLNVSFVVDGIAASMMAMLLTNPAHTIKAAKYAKFMYHRIQGTVRGNPDVVRAGGDMMELFEKDLIDMMAIRMKVTADECKSKFFHRRIGSLAKFRRGSSPWFMRRDYRGEPGHPSSP